VPVAWAAGDPEPVPVAAGVVATRIADRHLTLVFLGRPPDEDVMALWASLGPLELPAAVAPQWWERFGRSAVALVVSDDGGLLEAAAEACHIAAEGLIGVRRPPSFRPHVTMARVPRRARPPSNADLRTWTVPSGRLEVGALTLFRTRPDQAGDRYERVTDRR
jgi:2'-5' RNA ligase